MDQALCSAQGQAGRGRGTKSNRTQCGEAGLEAAGGAPPITLPILGPQIRGPAGGLFVVCERLQRGVLEGCGAEGLLPWLLGVPVLWYGGGSQPCSSCLNPPAFPFHWLI